jgi:uncharacterized UPF0160 family protein
MSAINRQICIATHNGTFHADDAVSVAVLLKLFPEARVIRTRDEALIKNADFAVDVGGEWDPARGRFDHHQKGFAGKRESGVVYASSGLIWAHFGSAYAQTICRQGVTSSRGYDMAAIVDAFNTTRDEEKRFVPSNASAADKTLFKSQLMLEQFLKAVDFVSTILERLVLKTASELQVEEVLRKTPTLFEGRVLVHEESLAASPVVTLEMPDVLFEVYPDSSDKQWQIRVVREELGSFKARKDLPASWAGLRDKDLAEVTGVADAVFCHNGRFIAGAGSFESVMKLAHLALAA